MKLFKPGVQNNDYRNNEIAYIDLHHCEIYYDFPFLRFLHFLYLNL